MLMNPADASKILSLCVYVLSMHARMFLLTLNFVGADT